MSNQFTIGDFTFTLLRGLGPERALWEWRILACGLHLPMADHAEWARVTGLSTWFLGVEGIDGECLGGCAIQVHPSRALSGYRILRVERFGGSVAAAAWEPTLLALATVGERTPRILRLYVELFALEAGKLPALSLGARRAGLLPSPHPRCYGTTALVDLTPAISAVFEGFHKTARQNIRAAGKYPVKVSSIDDQRLVPRMNELLRETLARTGGGFESQPWSEILEFSRVRPDRSRVVGLFRTDKGDPNLLLAFAWGRFHGDHVQYATAASTRSADLKVPMAYPLAWDLIQWAHQQAARHFDFGGLSEGSHGSADPLGGISDFKRYFKGEPARVGDEWMLEPSRVAAGIARSGAHLVDRLRRGLRM